MYLYYQITKKKKTQAAFTLYIALETNFFQSKIFTSKYQKEGQD